MSIGRLRVAIQTRFCELLAADPAFAKTDEHPSVPVLPWWDASASKGELVYIGSDVRRGDVDGSDIRARPGNWHDDWTFDLYCSSAYPNVPQARALDRVAEMVDAAADLLAANPALGPTSSTDPWYGLGRVLIEALDGPGVVPTSATGWVALARIEISVVAKVHPAH